MAAPQTIRLPSLVCALLLPFGLPLCAGAQAPGSSGLPPTAPTGVTAPIAATATPADRPGATHHRAEVSCAGGQLQVRADNSSLNGILRSISRCTGMTISGGVLEQRVFGNYGPAAPATVLATLLDGTDTNMLLLETASDQPAKLILTPRTGGATPPSPNQVPDDDADAAAVAPPQPQPQPPLNQPGRTPANSAGSGFGGPVSIPQPLNNVNGSPSNVSPTASTYPTTNSVPLDSLPTPSTTPSTSGIVSAPNPPAPGSDTARMLNGSTTAVPGTTNITPAPTSNATLPGATNTTTPVPQNAGTPSGAPGKALTPQDVYRQLQELRQTRAHSAQGQTQGKTPTETPAQPASTPQ